MNNKQDKNDRIIVMAFNATFHNISVMSRRSVLFFGAKSARRKPPTSLKQVSKGTTI
jgi:hypothetical protein